MLGTKPLNPFTFQLMILNVLSFFVLENGVPGCQPIMITNNFQLNNKLNKEGRLKSGFTMIQKNKNKISMINKYGVINPKNPLTHINEIGEKK